MVSITHPFVSAKSNGADNTLVRPSNWNAAHTFVTSGSNVILGVNGAAGAVQEISCTAQGFNAFSSTDVLLPTTGDVKLTIKSVADSGWLMMDDSTIGDASSGAFHVGAQYSALFQLLYNNTTDANCPVFTSGGGATTRGAQGLAATAFANHCRIQLPVALGRALGVAGSGFGLTPRQLGQFLGEEAHALVVGELAPHTHGAGTLGTSSAGDHSHAVPIVNSQTFASGNTAVGKVNGASDVLTSTTGAHTHTINGTTGDGSGGGGMNSTPHNNMQPTTFFNVMIKL